MPHREGKLWFFGGFIVESIELERSKFLPQEAQAS
jgi:hypothetical protein